jgi:DNA-binding NarL/FixJ family response regulator
MVLVRKAYVALIDDHPLFRQGLAAVLNREPDLAVIGEAGDAEHALELARRFELDAAVIDVLMPEMSGISLASELLELQPRCKVLGLSAVEEPGLIADMLRARAGGFAL